MNKMAAIGLALAGIIPSFDAAAKNDPLAMPPKPAQCSRVDSFSTLGVCFKRVEALENGGRELIYRVLKASSDAPDNLMQTLYTDEVCLLNRKDFVAGDIRQALFIHNDDFTTYAFGKILRMSVPDDPDILPEETVSLWKNYVANVAGCFDAVASNLDKTALPQLQEISGSYRTMAVDMRSLSPQ